MDYDNFHSFTLRKTLYFSMNCDNFHSFKLNIMIEVGIAATFIPLN